MLLLRARAIFIDVDRFTVASLPVVGASFSDQSVNMVGDANHSEISRQAPERPEGDELMSQRTESRRVITNIAFQEIAVLPIQMFGNVRFGVKRALKERIGGRTLGMVDCPA